MSTVPVPHDLVGTLQDMGLRIGRVSDQEVWCLCPAHERRTGKEDRKASNFSVNRNTGDAYCFGCKFSANLVGLCYEVMGLGTWEALGWLREHGASLTEYVSRVNDIIEDRDKTGRGKTTTTPGYDETDPDLEFVLLDRVPDKELAKRNLSSDSADTYLVRWQDGKWVLPFIDASGRIHGWQLKDGSFVMNYPKGRLKKKHFLFGINTFVPGQRAYIVESPLDAVRIHTAGFDGALATYGAGVSHEQVRHLTSITDDIVLVMDNDEAGWAATKWLRTTLLTRTRRLHIATYEGALSGAKDPGDLSDRGIERLLDEATSAVTWRAA